MRCGDHVFHRPTGQKWLVAYVDGDYLAWCGWPEGEARVADCDLVKTCSDEEHLKLLTEIASIPLTDKRGRMAKESKMKLSR